MKTTLLASVALILSLSGAALASNATGTTAPSLTSLDTPHYLQLADKGSDDGAGDDKGGGGKGGDDSDDDNDDDNGNDDGASGCDSAHDKAEHPDCNG